MSQLPALPDMLAMRPVAQEKIWGGTKLDTHWQRPVPQGVAIGETWEISALPGAASRVHDGPLDGTPLDALVETYGHALCGPRDDLGLLVKLIDAAKDLSVQVHPDARAAARTPGAASKDECWLVLDVDEGGAVLFGLKPGTSKADFQAALDARAPEPLMNRVAVKPGDVLHITPGTVHAICQGVLLLEVQEPSDTTYRLWDYERPGLDGKLRPLHIAEAMDCTRFGGDAARATTTLDVLGTTPRTLVDGAHYRVMGVRGHTALRLEPNHATPVSITLTAGSATLEGQDGHRVALSRGDSALIPATGAATLLTANDATVILAGLGGDALPAAVTLA